MGLRAGAGPDRRAYGLRQLVRDPVLARRLGAYAREFALAHYGLKALLANWDELLTEVST